MVVKEARQDSSFHRAYGVKPPYLDGKEWKWLMPASADREPTQAELDAIEARKAKAAAAAIVRPIPAARANDCMMKIGNLMMIFKGPMMQPNKSKAERQNDLFVMVRNMFAAMDPDIVEPLIGSIMGSIV